MTFLSIGILVALSAFIWFNTNGVYVYLSKIINILPFFIKNIVYYFTSVDIYESAKKYRNKNWAFFIKDQFRDSFIGGLLSCPICFNIFFSIVLAVSTHLSVWDAAYAVYSALIAYPTLVAAYKFTK